MEPNKIAIVAVTIPESEWDRAVVKSDSGQVNVDRPSNEKFKQLLIEGINFDTYEILEWFDE